MLEFEERFGSFPFIESFLEIGVVFLEVFIFAAVLFNFSLFAFESDFKALAAVGKAL